MRLPAALARVIALVLILATASVATAQQAPAPSPFEAKLTSRGTGHAIKVTRNDGTQIKGVIVSIDTDSFQITAEHATQPTRIPYSDVKKIGNTGLSTAAKIGIGIGIGIVVVILVIVISLKANGF